MPAHPLIGHVPELVLLAALDEHALAPHRERRLGKCLRAVEHGQDRV
jgi:hypothetical protein